MPWKEIDSGKFDGELNFTKKLISLRKTHPAMRSPEYEFVYSDSDKTGSDRIVHIVKTAEDGSEKIGVVVDCGSSGKDISVFAKDREILLSADKILIYRM